MSQFSCPALPVNSQQPLSIMVPLETSLKATYREDSLLASALTISATFSLLVGFCGRCHQYSAVLVTNRVNLCPNHAALLGVYRCIISP
jgi:hypothetical protein